MIRLTPRQRAELQALRRDMQYTFGKGRARVQNALVGHGLAEFVLDGDRCRILPAGAAWLAKWPTGLAADQVSGVEKKA